MCKRVRELFKWVPRGADLWLFLGWLFPPLGGAVTWWQAAIEDAPWYLIIFYSTGVFCFCALAVAAAHYVSRHRAVFERLRYVGTEPLFVYPNPAENTIGIMFKCKLMNMSTTRSIYIALRRGDARLQGRSNPNPVLKDELVIVPPFSEFAVSIAAVPDINVSQEIKGKLEVEVAYGPGQDDLRYLLTYEVEPRLEIRDLTEKDAKILFTGPVKKYQHKKT